MKRQSSVLLRLTPAQKKKLDAEADALNMTTTALVRLKLFPPKFRSPSAHPA